MKSKPYVISEDIDILLKEWCEKREFMLPKPEFFKKLRQGLKGELEKIFGKGNVEMITVEELRKGMQKLIKKTGLPAVSMDKVYIKTNPAIEVSRAVNKNFKDCGIVPRFGAPPLKTQIKQVREKFKEIVLVDDVIFSGEAISQIVLLLERAGVKVPVVVAGIAIEKGFKNLKEKTDVEILAVRYYKAVIDEICERDFYPGVPLCGRTLANSSIDIGVPYLLPFAIDPKGKSHLEEWASIPKEHQEEFSKFCLEQTIQLWEEIENLSQKPVRISDLERIPIGLWQQNFNPHFLEHLKKFLKSSFHQKR